MTLCRWRLQLLLAFISSAAFSQTSSGYIQVNNGKLYYEVYGQGKPLVFLNGGPGISSSAYRYIADYFQAERQVILFDQRGTGNSRIRPMNKRTICLQEMVHDLEALRNHLGIETWDVAGQSFGGVYAIQYAIDHSERIEHMILISTPGVEKNTYFAIQNLDTLSKDELLPEESILWDTMLMLRSGFPSTWPTYQLYDRGIRSRYFIFDKAKLRMQMDWFIHTAQYAFKTQKLINTQLEKINPGHFLPSIQCPTLIIYGTSDFIPLSVQMYLDEYIPDSELILLSQCGHSVWLDQGSKVKQLISQFLDQDQ